MELINKLINNNYNSCLYVAVDAHLIIDTDSNEKGGGNLIAKSRDGTGIGANYDGNFGSITINSGNITAEAGGTGAAAGIGTAEFRTSKNIKITGGNIIAKEIPERLKNIAYIKGYEDGRFKPNNNITRAEAATMLYRLIYDGTQIDTNILERYNDVKRNNWATAAVAYLTQHEIMQGFDGEFRPNDKITRAEFAKIVYESLLKYSTNENSKLIYGENEFKFSDVKNDWSFEPIKQLATNEMINGYENDLFKPNENITRAEAVKIINKAFGRSENWINSISFNDVGENHWAYKFIMNATNGEK